MIHSSNVHDRLYPTTFPEEHSIGKENGSLLFWGLLVYAVAFYSQIGARIPFLGAIRFEFILGSALLLASIAKLLSGRIDLRESRFHLAAFLFFTFVMASVPFAYVKSRALETAIDFSKYFAIYLFIISAIDSEKRLKWFMYVYLAMVALIFVQPFILSLSGKGFIYMAQMMRLRGVTNYFAHPNQLAMMTCENLPFFYYFARSEKSKTRKIILYLLVLIGIRVIMLTQSRTGMIGLAIFAFFIWLTSRRKALGAVILAVLLTLFWYLAPDNTKYRLSTLGQTSTIVNEGRSGIDSDEMTASVSSMASRMELAQSTLRTFSENPLIGVGPNCAGSYSGRSGGSWFPPHNTYLQALAELGLIGTSLFFLVVYFTIKNLVHARKFLRKAGHQNSFLFILVYALTAYYSILLIVSTFGIELYANYWWLAGGLSVVINQLSKAKYEKYVYENMREKDSD
jgi:putative inorganic carbon (hco3(-)) transporter